MEFSKRNAKIPFILSLSYWSILNYKSWSRDSDRCLFVVLFLLEIHGSWNCLISYWICFHRKMLSFLIIQLIGGRFSDRQKSRKHSSTDFQWALCDVGRFIKCKQVSAPKNESALFPTHGYKFLYRAADRFNSKHDHSLTQLDV